MGQLLFVLISCLWICSVIGRSNPSPFLTSGQLLSQVYEQNGPSNKYIYRTEYFESYIDHFGFANDEKFKVKYLINEDHYKPGGAIFFYTGNEGIIEAFADNTGIMWFMAPQHHATIIFMEHRYYGDSKPFGKASFENRTNFAYFTAEQALADFATFLANFKETRQEYANTPVIAFGGSYGGMLTAWFRAKYPNIVTGALAASAPVFGFPNMTNCEYFNSVLTNAFNTTGSPNCVQSIKDSWEIISMRDAKLLTKEFKLCKELPSSEVLKDYLNEFYGEIAMVNYPYPVTFLGDYPAWPVNAFCKPFKNDTNSEYNIEELMAKLSEGLWNNKNYTGKLKCLDLNAGSGGVDDSGWFLQTCLEMQLPICSDGQNDMFLPEAYDPSQIAQQCASNFQGVVPRADWSIVQFGGKGLSASLTNIIFSNGNLDPWSAMGVLKAKDAPGANLITLKNGAHHLDLREPHALLPQDVKMAVNEEWKLIRTWIIQYYKDLYYA